MQQFQKYIATEPQRNRKDLESNNMGSWIINATDIEYIENRSYKGKGENWSLDWLWGGGIIFFFITMRPYKGGIGLYFFLGVSLLLAFGYLYHYIAPTKYFVANRQTGKLKVPISMKKPAVWIDFNKGFAYEKTAYLDNFYTSLFFQTKPEVKPGAVFSLADWEREDYWNFLVWYMDKNRPLPPGTAFDEYRQRDFERRKAAGFPKPLYKSAIPTPEATPEQQQERRKIGGW